LFLLIDNFDLIKYLAHHVSGPLKCGLLFWPNMIQRSFTRHYQIGCFDCFLCTWRRNEFESGGPCRSGAKRQNSFGERFRDGQHSL